jgi:twitching motility two-component system response regulator PilH
MVSQKSDKTDQVWASRQGAKAYITKPVNGERLIDSIKNFLVS